MLTFDLTQLSLPVLTILGMTIAVTFHMTRSPVFSLIAGIVKTSLFALYFGIFFDGTFTFLDDWTYLDGGQELLKQRVGLSNLYDHLELVFSAGGGGHILYYLYNVYAFRLFGEGYFAPVACNVLLTLVIATLGARLAEKEFGFSRNWKKLFFVFLLFHPDILAWSNVMNGKDTLVLLSHVILLTAVSLFIRGQIGKALILAFPTVLSLFFLRFYVPLLFSAALLVAIGFRAGGYGRIWLLLCVASLFGGSLVFLGMANLAQAVDLVQEKFVNPAYGLVRFLFTPIPFNTEEAYAFLDISAALHWLMMPCAGYGLLYIYRRRTLYSRAFLYYLAAFVFLYAVFGELQGPRHRVQLDYAWALLQFIGLRQLIQNGIARKDQSPISGKEQVVNV
ncbi:hypothetical protein [Crenobacter cavernae]|uniref:hypothetical protein n=1 Tax=Crenobacter cavernae TaxID=2290923 RepID=UPI00100E571F|nr:hypothetical protein [Crenobacter cavernae]